MKTNFAILKKMTFRRSVSLLVLFVAFIAGRLGSGGYRDYSYPTIRVGDFVLRSLLS